MVKGYFNYILFFITIFFISCSKDDGRQENANPVTVETRDMSFNISENPNPNQLIGTVAGSTNQGSVTFSIMEQTPVGAFKIDSGTGELFVDDASIYDFETVTSITGKVKVANGSISGESTILIAVRDVDEDIYVGDVALRSQEEVDAFGLNNYREIMGFLSIADGEEVGSPITDLSGLNGLEKIDGRLSVLGTNNLVALTGLENLTSADECRISSNNNLEDISALQNISSLSFLWISFNPKLTITGTFANIKNLENGFRFVENNSMTSLPELNNLESVGYLRISQNQTLNNIADISALTIINGDLYIESNPSLVNLIGLSNLQTIAGELRIINNDALFDINSIQNLTSVQDEIYINLNDNLQHLDGLVGLTAVKYLQVYFNGSLQHLDGLANLESVEENLVIGENNSLNDFCGLTTLVNNDSSFTFSVLNNLFNPTIEDILNQNCSN